MFEWLAGKQPPAFIAKSYEEMFKESFQDYLIAHRELVIANRALARKSAVITRLKSYLKEYEKKYGKLNKT